MKNKIYSIGNYFYLLKTGADEPLQDAKALVTCYPVDESAELWRMESPNIGRVDILLADMEDEGGTPYTTGTWETFYTQNTGFNPASGGSGAVTSVAGKTGAVTLVAADITNLLRTKSGRVLQVSFTGNPKRANVVFTTPFSDANYSPVLTCETTAGTTFAPVVESVAPAGFTILMGANNVNDLIAVNWVAIKHGEH